MYPQSPGMQGKDQVHYPFTCTILQLGRSSSSIAPVFRKYLLLQTTFQGNVVKATKVSQGAVLQVQITKQAKGECGAYSPARGCSVSRDDLGPHDRGKVGGACGLHSCACLLSHLHMHNSISSAGLKYRLRRSLSVCQKNMCI